MQIDWFTVVAQLFNFLVLVWLLKRFLYKPVLDAIDAREKSIAQTLQAAAATQLEATQAREKFVASSAELDQQRATLLQQATEAAQLEQQKLLQAAHSAADALGRKRQLELRRELQQLREEINRLTLVEVFAITRKLLTELSGTTLEQCMVTTFTEQLQTMEQGARTKLLAALTAEPALGLVRSSFVLDARLQQNLQNNINAWAGSVVPLKFETSDKLICGLELNARGQQLAWNMAASIDVMEQTLNEKLAAAVGTEVMEPGNVEP